VVISTEEMEAAPNTGQGWQLLYRLFEYRQWSDGFENNMPFAAGVALNSPFVHSECIFPSVQVLKRLVELSLASNKDAD